MDDKKIEKRRKPSIVGTGQLNLVGYDLYYHNGVHMGEVMIDEDGFYKFWPNDTKGYWDEHMLFLVGNLLKEKNKAWNEELERWFKEYP